MSDTTPNTPPEPKRLGLLAEFAGPTELVEAAQNATDDGYERVEAFSPFAMHGIDDALKSKKTILPWLVLAMGLTGGTIGLAMQCYTNGTEWGNWLSGYDYTISAKPSFSIPAFMPVTFELIILLASLTAFFGVILLNQLPKLSNPLFRSERFRRVTDDGFFLFVESDDPKYADAETEAYLTSLGASAVEAIDSEVVGTAVPGFLPLVGACAASIALLVPLWIWASSSAPSSTPRISWFQDMEAQAKYKPQTTTSLFSNGQSMRKAVPGTVARGGLREDLQLYFGLNSRDDMANRPSRVKAQFVAEGDEEEETPEETPAEEPQEAQPDWTTQIPLPVTSALMERGEQRFNIHCAACHGLGGDGDGLVTQRAMALEQGTWLTPTSLHVAAVVEQPVGQLFDTISNGVRKMPGYKELIAVEDRWAIVLYVQALQRTRTAIADGEQAN